MKPVFAKKLRADIVGEIEGIMKTGDDTAIIVRDVWGKILSGLVVAGILGGISFAFAQQDSNAETRTNIQILKESDKERNERIDKIDSKVDSINDKVGEIHREQTRISVKLDQLMERQQGAPAR